MKLENIVPKTNLPLSLENSNFYWRKLKFMTLFIQSDVKQINEPMNTHVTTIFLPKCYNKTHAIHILLSMQTIYRNNMIFTNLTKNETSMSFNFTFCYICVHAKPCPVCPISPSSLDTLYTLLSLFLSWIFMKYLFAARR